MKSWVAMSHFCNLRFVQHGTRAGQDEAHDQKEFTLAVTVYTKSILRSTEHVVGQAEVHDQKGVACASGHLHDWPQTD